MVNDATRGGAEARTSRAHVKNGRIAVDATSSNEVRSPYVPKLPDLLTNLEIQHEWDWAYEHFEKTVSEIIRTFAARDVCELGGGRTPFFSGERVREANLRYVVNDISAAELDRSPEWVNKACFDVSGPDIPDVFNERFDFVFSHMLMEHVKDGNLAHKNVFNMLRPGGVYFHFHPVLYSPAVVANWLFPEWLSKRILRLLQPNRHDEGYPKFPAAYSFCAVNKKTITMVRSLGFREVALIPFYGNDYLKKLPLLQKLDYTMSTHAKRTGKAYLASLCYSIGVK